MKFLGISKKSGTENDCIQYLKESREQKRLVYSSVSFQLLLALILLFVGGMIYIAFRSTSLVMFSWFNELGMNTTVESIRKISNSFSLPYFIKYCMPNAFWITSYILVVDALVQIDNYRLLWAMTLPVISIVCEILQIWKVVPGIFDTGDLICFIFPAVAYIVFYKIKYNETIS